LAAGIVMQQASGPPSPHAWISEPRAQHVRSACASTGRLFAVASVALGTAVVLFGLRLPIAYHFFGPVVWINGGASALAVLFSALGLAGARSYLQGGYLDVGGARRTRRMLAVMWATAIVFSSSACFLLLVTVAAESDNPRHPEVRFTIGVWAYLCLLASPSVLAGVLSVVGRRLLVTAPPPDHPGAAAAPAMPYPPPQRHVWISAQRAHAVRVACGRLGAAMLTIGALLPPIIVLIGGQLPPIYPALGVLGWTFAAIVPGVHRGHRAARRPPTRHGRAPGCARGAGDTQVTRRGLGVWAVQHGVLRRRPVARALDRGRRSGRRDRPPLGRGVGGAGAGARARSVHRCRVLRRSATVRATGVRKMTGTDTALNG
jgi:hypothetical protein